MFSEDDIYLSIDLDYWNGSKNYEGMLNVFKYALRNKTSVFVCFNHQDMSKKINKCKYGTLVNMDYHSDLTFIKRMDWNQYKGASLDKVLYDKWVESGVSNPKVLMSSLKWSSRDAVYNCGTWVNYVKNIKNKNYHWVYPNKEAEIVGDCACQYFEKLIPTFWRNGTKYTGWGKTMKSMGLCKKCLSRDGNIGICISPPYTDPEIQITFYTKILPILERRKTSLELHKSCMGLLKNKTRLIKEINRLYRELDVRSTEVEND